MTPKEVREHIIGLKTGLAATEANLKNLREDRDLDAELLNGFGRTLADFDKRLSFLERDAAERSKHLMQFGIAVAVAIITAIGAVVAAVVSRGK